MNTIEQTTVAICTCNRQHLLEAALASLVRLRMPSDLQYHIVVVDDGSRDGTPEVVRDAMKRSPVEIRYIRHDANKGIPFARNACVREAKGTSIAFFDDDQIADPMWLANLVGVARKTGADCVGGPYLMHPPADKLPASLRRMLGENPIMLKQLPARLGIDPRRRQSAMAAAMGTGNVLLRRSLFDEIGLFSETRHRGEDIEFFLRAWKHGAKFAVAADAVIHHVIPPERLAPAYLLSAANRGGSVNAEIDVDVAGLPRALWNMTLRIVHLVVWTIPSLGAASILRDEYRTLAKKCSLRFAVNYIACVMGVLRKGLLPVRP